MKYYVQVFDGAPADGDDLLYVGRLAYNFRDAESGFTNSGSYFGKKDVLSVAASVLSENGDDAWTLDALYEQNFGSAGVVTLEGAYFNYNDLAVNNDVAVDGDVYFLQAAYRLPQAIGFGHLQPFIRHQDADFDNADGDRLDIGMNYLIRDYNALVTVMWARDNDLGIRAGEFDIFRIGAQIQF